MAYQSKHTGAAIDAAIDAVVAKEKQWDDKQDKLTGNAGQLVIFDENGNPIAQDMPDIDIDTDNLVTLEGGGEIDMAEIFGEGPYVISFTPDEEGEVAASLITYDNADSALLATNVQDAIDEIAMSAGDMTASVYDPQGKQTDIFAYVDDAVSDIPTPDVSGQIGAHDESANAHMKIQNDFLQWIEDSESRTLQTVNARINAAVANVPTGTVNGSTDVTIVGGDGIEIMTMVTPDMATGRSSSELIISATGSGSGVTVHTAIIGTSWTEDSDTGVKSQNVAIEGVMASNTATVDHVFTDGTEYADFVEAENQYLEFITNGYAETYDGGVTFHIFGDAPTVEIPIVVEVV